MNVEPLKTSNISMSSFWNSNKRAALQKLEYEAMTLTTLKQAAQGVYTSSSILSPQQ